MLAATAAETVATRAAIASLNVYQKYISPRKGFACPHRLLHGDESCSNFVKRMLIQQDLRTALRLAPRRFQACQAAAQTLQTRSESGYIVVPCCFPI